MEHVTSIIYWIPEITNINACYRSSRPEVFWKKVFFKKSVLVMNKLFISNSENYRKRQIV